MHSLKSEFMLILSTVFLFQVGTSGKKCLFVPCNGKDNFKTSGSKGIATLLNRSEELGDTAIHETLSNIIATHGASAFVLCHKSC